MCELDLEAGQDGPVHSIHWSEQEPGKSADQTRLDLNTHEFM